MAQQTVDTLANTVATEFGEEFGDTDIASQFHTWVIDVVTDVMTNGRWWFLNGEDTITMVNGTRTYDLDTDVSEVRLITDDDNGEVIHYAAVETLTRRGLTLTTTGDAPTHWYVDGVGASGVISVGLYPVPNVTAAGLSPLNVKTVERPPTMTSSSTINLPEEYINAVKDGVRSLVHANDGTFDAANLYFQKYRAAIELLSQRFHGKNPPPTLTPASSLKAKGDAPVSPESM